MARREGERRSAGQPSCFHAGTRSRATHDLLILPASLCLTPLAMVALILSLPAKSTILSLLTVHASESSGPPPAPACSRTTLIVKTP